MRNQLEELTYEYLGTNEDGVAKGLLSSLEHSNPDANDNQARPIAAKEA